MAQVKDQRNNDNEARVYTAEFRLPVCFPGILSRCKAILNITKPECYDEWIALFHEFDTNKNGELCKEEVKTLMRVCGTNPTDKEIDDYIGAADKNDDRKIDCNEFCSFMEKQCAQGDPADILREAFDWYDKDNNGYIDHIELKGILKDCGEDPNDKALIDELIKSADLNGDGKIDLDEFVYRMQYA